MDAAEVLAWFAAQPRWWRCLVHRAIDAMGGRTPRDERLLNYLRLFLAAEER